MWSAESSRQDLTESSHGLVCGSRRFLTCHCGAYSKASRAWARIWVGTAAVIDYRLLGPIEAGVNGHALDIGGQKQRALLTILLLSANEPVSREVLIDRLWGECPPA